MDELKQKLKNFRDSELFPHYVGGFLGLFLSILFGGLITAEADEVVESALEEDVDESNTEVSLQ